MWSVILCQGVHLVCSGLRGRWGHRSKKSE